MPKPSDDSQHRARNWLGTWNNPPTDGAQALQDLYENGSAVYLVG